MIEIIKVKDIESVEKCNKEIKRLAVKGIVKENDKILFLRTNKNDYKFPGGGLRKGESHQEGLKREMLEETGYKIREIKKPFISFIEKKPDAYEEGLVFIMESQYWFCTLDTRHVFDQALDAYEADQEFKVEYVSLEEAYRNNLALLEIDCKSVNPWVKRETEVIKHLLDCEMKDG